MSMNCRKAFAVSQIVVALALVVISQGCSFVPQIHLDIGVAEASMGD
jgi:hypothetical protein